MSDTPKPSSFDFEEPENRPAKKGSGPQAIDLENVEIIEEVSDILDGQGVDLEDTSKSRISWTAVFFTALLGLLSLAVGLWIDELIRDLFNRHSWLGYVGLALTVLIVFTCTVIIIRELWAISRMRQVEKLRLLASGAYEENDHSEAAKLEGKLLTLYASKPQTAKGRALIKTHRGDIIDGKDRITLLEEHLMKPLDHEADKLVMNAAKRVAIVTAVSPRALIDILYVLAENIRLIRGIAEVYSGRPGFLGTISLARKVVTHLAITGAISIGDGLVQQVIGHGIASRLSARFGEGVVNGLMTARIGLAAHDLCRPIPFLGTKRPGVSGYLNALVGLSGSNKS